MERTPDFKKYIQEGYGDQQFEGTVEDVVDLPSVPDIIPESPRVQGTFDEQITEGETKE